MIIVCQGSWEKVYNRMSADPLSQKTHGQETSPLLVAANLSLGDCGNADLFHCGMRVPAAPEVRSAVYHFCASGTQSSGDHATPTVHEALYLRAPRAHLTAFAACCRRG